MKKAQRQQDSPADLVDCRLPRDGLDDQPGQYVIGVGVAHLGARCEQGGLGQCGIDHLIGALRLGGEFVGVVEVFGQAALVAQQLTHGDGTAVDAVAVYPAGQIRFHGAVEIDPPFRDQLQHRRRDE